jgi:hypothetical protein
MLLTGLETPRLTIRDVLPSDVDAFHGYMKREQYWRDVPLDPPTLESIKAMVDRCLLDQEKEPRTDFFLAAIAKATGDVVGEAILHVRSLRSRQGRNRLGRKLGPRWAWLCDRDRERDAASCVRQAQLASGLCSVPDRESGFTPNHG